MGRGRNQKVRRGKRKRRSPGKEKRMEEKERELGSTSAETV